MSAPDSYVRLPAETINSDSAYSKGALLEDDSVPSAVFAGLNQVPFASVVNLFAAMVGAGMLGLPAGTSAAGWFVGLFLIIFSAILSGFSMHLISIVSRKIGDGQATFRLLAEEALPGYGGPIAEVAALVNVFGNALAYLVVIGSTMPYVAAGEPNNGTVLSVPWVWLTGAVVPAGALAFAPTLKSLRHVSTVGMAAIFYLVVMILVYYVQRDSLCGDDGWSPHCGGSVASVEPQLKLLKMLGICTFAFAAHVQALSVANEVQDYSQGKMNSVIFLAVFLAGGVYCVVALLGYLSFGDGVAGNVLASYPSEVLVQIGRAAISLVVLAAYPLQCKPGRDVFLGFLRNSSSPSWRAAAEGSAAYVGFTVTFVLGTYGIALVSLNNQDGFGIILGLLGATTSTMIAYVLPTLAYARLFPHPHSKRTLALATCAWGVLSMPVCILAIFIG